MTEGGVLFSDVDGRKQVQQLGHAQQLGNKVKVSRELQHLVERKTTTQGCMDRACSLTTSKQANAQSNQRREESMEGQWVEYMYQ